MDESKEIARLEYFSKHQEFVSKGRPTSEFAIMFKAYNGCIPTSQEINEYKKNCGGGESEPEDDYYDDEYEEDYEEEY